jgi:hypothetical protein
LSTLKALCPIEQPIVGLSVDCVVDFASSQTPAGNTAKPLALSALSERAVCVKVRPERGDDEGGVRAARACIHRIAHGGAGSGHTHTPATPMRDTHHTQVHTAEVSNGKGG